jgi:Flp pilus assembly pilin Flp
LAKRATKEPKRGAANCGVPVYTGGMKVDLVRAAVVRLAKDESGQDLIEYGLLVAVFGVGSFLVWPSMVATISNHFSNSESRALNLYQPLDPAGP